MKSTVKISEGIIPKDKPVQLKSGVARRLIHPDAVVKSKNVAVNILIMNPGDEVAPHYHNEKEEIYHILSGEGIAIHKGKEGEEKIKFEKNLSIYIPPKVIHDIKCTGNEPLWILVVMAPPLPAGDNHRA